MTAMYWNHSISLASKSEVLTSAIKVLKDAGYTSVTKGQEQTSGRKGDIFAFIGSIEKIPPEKSDPPSWPGGGGGIGTTTTAASQSVIIVAAGAGAKDAAADLQTRWNKVKSF